jgi:ABC-2 type transport system ATP-binding protein
MEEVTELCDRVIFMKEGQIIADDLPQNLTKTHKFHLKLTIADDMKKISAIVEEKKFSYKIDHRIIDIEIDEKEIPSFLNSLSRADVNYLNIKIEEPTLDDYFLQMARKIR